MSTTILLLNNTLGIHRTLSLFAILQYWSINFIIIFIYLFILIQILTMSVCSKIFPNHRDTGGFTSKPEVPQQNQGAWYVWSLKIFVCLTGGLLGHYWQPQLLDGAAYQLQSSLWQCWPWMPNNFLLLIPVLSYMACLPFSLFSSSSHPSSDSKICFIN